MALTIIRVAGPNNTGKSKTIRAFTKRHLKYKKKKKGDVLGIFWMPRRNYAVGVNGSGDNLDVVQDGLDFFECFDGLRVIIVACHLSGQTIEAVDRFARRHRAVDLPDVIKTKWLATEIEQDVAILENVSKIMNLMPGRNG
jgi:hypothetical protein